MSSPQPDYVPEPDLSNRQLGDYLIGRRLGRGGMADVYLAEQRSLRRHVAFKVLRSALAQDESYVRRFHHEAQAAASLVHANIVQIYEVGCLEGIHFIAQEYVDGQNLKQMIARRGKLDVRKVVRIMRQVAGALHKAAQHGIIHRDIKPENILLTSGGEVKVADFGLARVTSGDRRLDLTQVGMTMGTPLYMSPEQVESRPLDPRSDLYSFGVMCYEMFAGRPPFEADNVFSVAVQHLKTEPARLETFREDLPGGLARIVHKLLEKNPADRYQSAAEMLRDLRMVPVEGVDDWQVGSEEWSSVEWETIAASRMAATQKLGTVMLRESRLRSRWRWLSLSVLGIILAFSVGSGVAWILRPPLLLEAEAGEVLKAPRQPTAQAQFEYAQKTGKERDFEAVEEYFPRHESPQNEEYVRKAQLQLAYLYVENNRLDEALNLLEELADQNTDVMVQIWARVLQANVLARQGKESTMAVPKVKELARLMVEAKKDEERFRVRRELERHRMQREFEEAGWGDDFWRGSSGRPASRVDGS